MSGSNRTRELMLIVSWCWRFGQWFIELERENSQSPPRRAQRRRWLPLMWSWIGKNRDQILLLFAVSGGVIFVYEYLDRRYERRIERSIENAALHKTLDSQLLDVNWQYKWLSPEHAIVLATHATLDNELKEYIAENGFADKDYLKNFLRAHVQFRSAVWCPMSGLCDWHTSCRLMRSQLNPFVKHHSGMYAKWESIVKVDQRNILNEFMEICGKKDVLFYRLDSSWQCWLSVNIRSFFNFRPGSVCRNVTR